MTAGTSYVQSIAIKATTAVWFYIHFPSITSASINIPYNHLILSVIKLSNDEIMSLSIYVSFSNVLSLFLLLHCDPGLKLSFQVYFSGIYGMCWRLLEQRAAKRGLCGRFCGFISVFLNFVWYPSLLTVLWSKVMVPCTWLKRTPGEGGGISPQKASGYMSCFRYEKWW